MWKSFVPCGKAFGRYLVLAAALKRDILSEVAHIYDLTFTDKRNNLPVYPSPN